MKQVIACAALVLLGGCAPVSAVMGRSAPTGQADALRAIGEHLDNCDRHYQGSLGLGGSFTFNIDCKRRGAPQNR